MQNRVRCIQYADASRGNRPALRRSVGDEMAIGADISQHRYMPASLDLRAFAIHTALWDESNFVHPAGEDDTA